MSIYRNPARVYIEPDSVPRRYVLKIRGRYVEISAAEYVLALYAIPIFRITLLIAFIIYGVLSVTWPPHPVEPTCPFSDHC